MKNMKMTIIVLVLIVIGVLALNMLFMGGSSLFFEGLESNEKQRIMAILNNKRLTNNSKIESIIKLNVQDPRVQKVLNAKTKRGTPTTHVQKTIDLLKVLNS